MNYQTSVDAAVGSMPDRSKNLLKNKTTDRILVLAKLDEGKGTKNTQGLVDNRLFTGENKLHAIADIQTMQWFLRYDSGILPEPLKQRFTSFTKLMQFVTEYYKRRNIKIEKVID
jgi:hypothetical protein